MASQQQSRRTERIVERIRSIPEGFVRTYGDIDPGAPRLVGRVLSTTHDLPWHRVVRADGASRLEAIEIADGVSQTTERVAADALFVLRMAAQAVAAFAIGYWFFNRHSADFGEEV